MIRVTQQDSLYAAERSVPEHLRGRGFDSQAAIQRWVVSELLDQPWWVHSFGRVVGIHVPTVARRRTRCSVGYWDAQERVAVIEMHPAHWETLTVLHEVAHPVAEAYHGSRSHDPHFARIYLQLVYRVLGGDAWIALRTAFVEHGVCFDERCLEVPDCRCR